MDPESESNLSGETPLTSDTEKQCDSQSHNGAAKLTTAEPESADANKKKPKMPSRQLSAEVVHVPIECTDVIEYEWPPKSGDRYFIQEQISSLLDVKSFKRKYPELARRMVEPDERQFLCKELNLLASIPPHLLNHLTALNAPDVHDLLSSEYPAIHSEYQRVVADRMKRGLMDKQKELDVIKADQRKLEELRKKAIKSAAEFNSELQTVRRSERKYFWDMQTSVIQSPSLRWYKVPAEYSRPSPYPCALLPGQYVSHFKRFSQKQLSRAPLNTVAESRDLFPPQRGPPSPPPIHVEDEELQQREELSEAGTRGHTPMLEDSFDDMKQFSPSPLRTPVSAGRRAVLRRSSTSSSITAAAVEKKPQLGGAVKRSSRLQQKQAQLAQVPAPGSPAYSVASTNSRPVPIQLCSVCGRSEAVPTIEGQPLAHPPELMIKCAACSQEMHPVCIDMDRAMVSVVQKYAWCCIDCKTCSVCSKPDQEDAMMCCDRCDRGYHTFCVDLEMPPNGAWMCPNCQK